MANATFDTSLFMNTETSDANATRMMPCPVGDYPATVQDVRPRALDDGRVVMDVVWDIDDAGVKEVTKRQKVTVRQSVWLDMQNGVILGGEGVNVQLGKLRAALGQNKAGEAWSPGKLIGGVARVRVTHRADKDTGDIYDQVSAVSPL